MSRQPESYPVTTDEGDWKIRVDMSDRCVGCVGFGPNMWIDPLCPKHGSRKGGDDED